jgi:hypothetical protein
MVPLKILFIMALIGVVNRYGHPIRAAVVFAAVTAVSAVLGLMGGVPLADVVFRTAVSFVAAAAVFWLIDNVEGVFLGVLTTVAGATSLILLTWFGIG